MKSYQQTRRIRLGTHMGLHLDKDTRNWLGMRCKKSSQNFPDKFPLDKGLAVKWLTGTYNRLGICGTQGETSLNRLRYISCRLALEGRKKTPLYKLWYQVPHLGLDIGCLECYTESMFRFPRLSRCQQGR